MIPTRESLYLDGVRVTASLLVLLAHGAEIFDLPHVPLWGHQAVIAFFVLSGYVICHTADTRETTLRAFAAARLARLWSVLVPAVILTALCDAVGRRFGTYPVYAHIHADYLLIRVAATLSFTAESWVSIAMFSNGAAWSLSVEFWYYALFAAYTFIPAGRRRTITVCFAALMAGHKGLLLLPVWIMGVALQRSARLRRFGGKIGALCFVTGGAAVLLICAPRDYDAATALEDALLPARYFHMMAQARLFWLDWVLGVCIAAHLAGARVVTRWVPLERIAAPIRWCAGISFTAYLFHMPLLTLFAAFLPASQGLLAICLTIAIIAAVGPAVEGSRRAWRRLIHALIDRAAGLGDAAA